MKELDLNLLRYLLILVEEASVSGAAEKVDITQPAMSAALKRMRTIFQDPILVRTGQTMEATHRARQLVAAIGPILQSLQDVTRAKSVFRPKESRATFTLMGSDYVQFFILPRLMAAVSEAAPLTTIVQRPANPSKVLSWLESGQVDVGIGYLASPAESLRARVLLREEQVCIVRKTHPAIKKKLTAQVYGDLSHVAVSPGGAGLYGARIDLALKTSGIKRRIALTLPSFLAIPYVVASTDLIATLPRRLANYFATISPLAVVQPELIFPSFEISMFWHERVHADAANIWLRNQIVDASAHLAK